MPAAPAKPMPYIVAMLFGDGTMCTNAVLAPTAEMAGAVACQEAIRATKTEGALQGIAVVPLPAEFLRAALQAIETGESTARVLSLVPQSAVHAPELDGRNQPPDGA